MQLVSTFSTATGSRIAFDMAAIMRRAHQLGRFALAMCRTAAERHAQLSIWLRRAWREAHDEARALRFAADYLAGRKASIEAAAREAAAIAASYGNDAETIRNAITSETMRDRMNFAAVDRLKSALASLTA